ESDPRRADGLRQAAPVRSDDDAAAGEALADDDAEWLRPAGGDDENAVGGKKASQLGAFLMAVKRDVAADAELPCLLAQGFRLGPVSHDGQVEGLAAPGEHPHGVQQDVESLVGYEPADGDQVPLARDAGLREEYCVVVETRDDLAGDREWRGDGAATGDVLAREMGSANLHPSGPGWLATGDLVPIVVTDDDGPARGDDGP